MVGGVAGEKEGSAVLAVGRAEAKTLRPEEPAVLAVAGEWTCRKGQLSVRSED